ncbi:MAG: hypothetical protein HYV63_27865 [Candidatus Schekmanbacteria bacterium]|nr:hypothetical protein [Candidatus Schekmanbacteria bacterium]
MAKAELTSAEADRIAGNRQELRKALLREVIVGSLGHPATVFPTAAAALAVAWMVIFEPSLAPFLTAIGLGATAAASAVVNFFFRGPKLAEKYVKRLEAARQRRSEEGRQALRKRLAALPVPDGLRAFDELLATHERLDEALPMLEEQDPMRAVDVRMFGVEARERGLESLDRAATALEQLVKVDVVALRKQVSAINATLASRGAEGPLSAAGARRNAADRERLAALQARLAACDEGMARVSQMIASVEKATGLMESTVVKLASGCPTDPEFWNTISSDSGSLEKSDDLPFNLPDFGVTSESEGCDAQYHKE